MFRRSISRNCNHVNPYLHNQLAFKSHTQTTLRNFSNSGGTHEMKEKSAEQLEVKNVSSKDILSSMVVGAIGGMIGGTIGAVMGTCIINTHAPSNRCYSSNSRF